MKLFSEKLMRFKFLVLFIFILVEIAGFILLYASYKSPYLKIFDESKEISIEKTISITHTLNEILKVYLYRHLQDLKLVGKHMSFLSNNKINKNSQFHKNLNDTQDKKIYFATMEELKDNFSEYYNDNEKRFLYFDKYIKDYIENDEKRQYMVNDLMNKNIHPELNSISYYKLKGNLNTLYNDPIKKIAVKYLISILKTNLITRFMVKGKDLEIINYILLINDEIYFYPPEAYNNSLLFSMKDEFNCQDNFPTCVSSSIVSYLKNITFSQNISGYLFPLITFLNINFEKVMNYACLRIPFQQEFNPIDFSYSPLICMGINLTRIFATEFFQEKDAFNYIFFHFSEQKFMPIYANNKRVYDDVKRIFKDPKFGFYSLSPENNISEFRLFHFLYLELFEEPSLLEKFEISVEDIFNEFDIIKNKLYVEIENFEKTDEEYFTLDIEKTTCKSDIYYNGKKCSKDSFLLIIFPFISDYHLLNEHYIENPQLTFNQTLFYSMSITSTNYNYMKWKINQIVVFKIIKLFIFYFISSLCLIFLYFIFVQIFFENKYYSINQILQVIKGGTFFELKNKEEIIQEKQEIKIEPNNKEMNEIKNLFEYLVKSMLLKIDLGHNENNFNNKSSNSKQKEKNQVNNNKNIKANNALMDKNNFDTLNEYFDLINNINNEEVRIMFSFIISYEHFRKGFYKLAENEFKNLILDMNKYQNKIFNKNENNDSKLKDSISRCSKISYLNEYSLTNELSETTLPIIKVKLMSQKIYYLYALSIYNQEKIKSSSDKKYNKENSKKRYEEAIKYFIECKNISILLGIDTIRQIFSLIMISKCFLELNNYKESMININEALLLFSDLQKSFKDKPYFNSNMMMFTENYIFQSIMLAMSQTIYNFNKYPQCCWILMKMIETSPFVFNAIHFQSSFLLCNCLTQIESLNSLPFRQTDKYKKKISKMFARINIRLVNKEKNSNKDSKSNTNSNNLALIQSTTNTQVNNISVSIENLGNASNLKKMNRSKEMFTNKYSVSLSSFNHLTRNRYKNIILCISEKLLQEINGAELKDVLIKFYKKCFFKATEEDKFGFIQFSCNGKKTISMKSDSFEIFLQKLELNKLAFKINDIYTQNYNEIQFMEFSNLFLSIIKSNKQANYEDRGDNIIILFINTSDIRFNSHKECVDTINELNNNNYSVIIFTYDNEIEEEKIEGIYSFVNGLNDGHFFKLKNYQQIKQVFMNFSIKNSQEKFNSYNYEITDYML